MTNADQTFQNIYEKRFAARAMGGEALPICSHNVKKNDISDQLTPMRLYVAFFFPSVISLCYGRAVQNDTRAQMRARTHTKKKLLQHFLVLSNHVM